MKQLDVVVSPPAFLWDPYLTLTNWYFFIKILFMAGSSWSSVGLVVE